MGERRFQSLDEAVEEINRQKTQKGVGHVEPKSEVPAESQTEPKYWSYTSKQGIENLVAPGNEAAEHHVADHEVGRASNGFHYQKCRGGRRVIHKRIGGN